MTTDDTTLIIKDPKTNTSLEGSQFYGISIRAWLALFVIGTVCLITLMTCIRAIYVKDYAWTPDGQFWMLASGILAHYFGTNSAKKEDSTSTQTTSTKTTV